MDIKLGRDICGNLAAGSDREWLVTNGIGGYASGTVSGLLTRSYHGLLLATIAPPVDITLMLTKLDETVDYDGVDYPLHTNRWASGTIAPDGYRQLQSFRLDGTVPVWIYGCADALIEKRVWMQQGDNTTYIRYKMLRGSLPLSLNLKALVNYRDRHSTTQSQNLNFDITDRQQGIKVKAFSNAAELYLSGIKDREAVSWKIKNEWYQDFALAVEEYRGLNHIEDHLYAGSCSVDLKLGESVTIVASVDDWGFKELGLQKQQEYEQELIDTFSNNTKLKTIPGWIEQLVLAADRFIVDRSSADIP